MNFSRPIDLKIHPILDSLGSHNHFFTEEEVSISTQCNVGCIRSSA